MKLLANTYKKHRSQAIFAFMYAKTLKVYENTYMHPFRGIDAFAFDNREYMLVKPSRSLSYSHHISKY